MKNEMDIEHLSYDLPNRRLSIIHEIISKNACAMQRAQSPSLPERREVNEKSPSSTSAASISTATTTAAAIPRTTTSNGATTRGVGVVIFFMVTNWWSPALQLDAQLLAVLAHV